MRAVILVLTLLAASLAGCFQTPASTVDADAEPYSVSRVVRVHVDRENVDMLARIADEPSLIDAHRYDFLDPQLVIRVNRDIDPKLLTFTYTDRDGAEQTRPLSLLTGAPWLNPGSTVTVRTHMFSGGVLKTLQGEVLVDRTLDAPAWWEVGGYPAGIHMAPGARLVYDLSGEARQSFSLTDVKPSDPDLRYFLDNARANIVFEHDATLTLALAKASETITANDRHQARPLDIDVRGTLALPMEISFSGRNLTSGRVIDGGLEVRPATGLDYGLDGKLWWSTDGAPVRFDLDAATSKARVDVVAWLTGMPEAEEGFSCASKPRSAQCRPDEIPRELEDARSFGPDSFNLDMGAPVPDAAIVADLQRFLADDLRPGDEVHYRVDLQGGDIPGYERDAGFPDKLFFESVTRVLGRETVQVRAGTFDTYRVDQLIRTHVRTPEVRADDGSVFKPLDIQQKLVETTTWVDAESFVIVKSIATTPFDLGRIVDDVLGAIDARAWDDAPIARLAAENVDITATSTQSFELVERSGAARVAPWLLVGGMPLFFLAQEGIPSVLLDAADDETNAWS